MATFSKRFENGLAQYNINMDDLKENWAYCGGSKGRHLNYYNIVCPNEEIPIDENACVCGHRIKENCYITNGDYIITIGNCCIKKFLKYTTRTCEVCRGPHRNRKDNRCKGCRRRVTFTIGDFSLTFK